MKRIIALLLCVTLSAALAGIPGNFKNHRSGQTVIRKLQFSGALRKGCTIAKNLHMAIGADTFQ